MASGSTVLDWFVLQVHNTSSWYHLTPFTLFHTVFNIQRHQVQPDTACYFSCCSCCSSCCCCRSCSFTQQFSVKETLATLQPDSFILILQYSNQKLKAKSLMLTANFCLL